MHLGRLITLLIKPPLLARPFIHVSEIQKEGMTPGRSFAEVQVETVSALEDLSEGSWNDLLERAEGCSIFQT